MSTINLSSSNLYLNVNVYSLCSMPNVLLKTVNSQNKNKISKNKSSKTIECKWGKMKYQNILYWLGEVGINFQGV